MIFTALRKFENGEATQEVLCTDEDFEIAQCIANTFIEHSVIMFNNLPKQEKALPFKGGNKQQFFIAQARDKAVRSVNHERVLMYWQIAK